LEIHFGDDGAYEQGLAILDTHTIAASDPATRRIQISVEEAKGGSLDILRRLDDAGVALTDFQLRRPTLDDVFLTLTKDAGEEAT
nr:DUF4162 domain-containing protein [Acidimicrobiia bacterium]